MINRFKTLKDHVYDFIADQILTGNLRPEEKINETSICQELSISRTPVREALIQLASEGILDNVPRKGFVVKSMTEKDAGELYVIIGNLDGLAARLSCPNLGEKEYKDMQFYVDSMGLAIESSNYEMYLNQQRSFHQVYLEKCGNDFLIAYIGDLKNKFIKKAYLDDSEGTVKKVIRATNAEHVEILRLLIEKKTDEVDTYLSNVHWSSENAHFDLISLNEK